MLFSDDIKKTEKSTFIEQLKRWSKGFFIAGAGALSYFTIFRLTLKKNSRSSKIQENNHRSLTPINEIGEIGEINDFNYNIPEIELSVTEKIISNKTPFHPFHPLHAADLHLSYKHKTESFSPENSKSLICSSTLILGGLTAVTTDNPLFFYFGALPCLPSVNANFNCATARNQFYNSVQYTYLCAPTRLVGNRSRIDQAISIYETDVKPIDNCENLGRADCTGLYSELKNCGFSEEDALTVMINRANRGSQRCYYLFDYMVTGPYFAEFTIQDTQQQLNFLRETAYANDSALGEISTDHQKKILDLQIDIDSLSQNMTTSREEYTSLEQDHELIKTKVQELEGKTANTKATEDKAKQAAELAQWLLILNILLLVSGVLSMMGQFKDWGLVLINLNKNQLKQGIKRLRADLAKLYYDYDRFYPPEGNTFVRLKIKISETFDKLAFFCNSKLEIGDTLDSKEVSPRSLFSNEENLPFLLMTIPDEETGEEIQKNFVVVFTNYKNQVVELFQVINEMIFNARNADFDKLQDTRNRYLQKIENLRNIIKNLRLIINSFHKIINLSTQLTALKKNPKIKDKQIAIDILETKIQSEKENLLLFYLPSIDALYLENERIPLEREKRKLTTEEEIAAHEAVIARLIQAYEDLSERHNQLSVAHHVLKKEQEKETENKEHMTLKKKDANLQQQLHDLEKNHHEFLEKYKELIERQSSSSEKYETLITNQQTEQEQLAKRYEQLTKEHEQLAKRHEQLQKDYQELISKHKLLTSGFEHFKKTVEIKHNQLTETLATQLKNVQEQLGNLNDQRQILVQQMESLTSEYTSMQNKLYEYQQRTENYQTVIEKFEKDQSPTKTEIPKSVKIQFALLTRDFTQHKISINTAIDELRKNEEELKNKISSLQTDIESPREFLLALQQENVVLQQQINSLEYQLGQLEEEIIQIKESSGNESLITHLTAVQKELSASLEQVKEKICDSQTIKNDLIRVLEKNQAYEQEITSLQNQLNQLKIKLKDYTETAVLTTEQKIAEAIRNIPTPETREFHAEESESMRISQQKLETLQQQLDELKQNQLKISECLKARAPAVQKLSGSVTKEVSHTEFMQQRVRLMGLVDRIVQLEQETAIVKAALAGFKVPIPEIEQEEQKKFVGTTVRKKTSRIHPEEAFLEVVPITTAVTKNTYSTADLLHSAFFLPSPKAENNNLEFLKNWRRHKETGKTSPSLFSVTSDLSDNDDNDDDKKDTLIKDSLISIASALEITHPTHGGKIQ